MKEFDLSSPDTGNVEVLEPGAMRFYDPEGKKTVIAQQNEGNGSET